ncbi:GNAT family protein [Microcella daejeonensis]|uniref:GNAT family N-acetyltransferase n=1 Tax=Microcella daejeonensis TaxID=2994971 RepID=UPI00226FB17A|nr:GNAT family protein [Microcella daejeonensis]WAB84387.1 GNAT family protein [Microcella daejeonensis]
MTARPLPLDALEGYGVRLEPFAPSHLEGLRQALARPEVFAGGWGGGPAAFCEGEAFDDWIVRYLPLDSVLPAPRPQVRVVRATAGPLAGRVLGTSTITDLVERSESAHIGYTAYTPQAWGGAVNPACKLLLLGHLFDHGYGRVKLQADVRNLRSRAAIARLGATFEGIARRDQQRADGSWRDTAIFSITIDDWPAVRAGLMARVADAV